MNSTAQRQPAATEATPIDERQVTTLALLIRRNGISPALFSRYWRDVHGVLAARIPGFESYVQYHLDTGRDDVLPRQIHLANRVRAAARFDGLAEVTFRDADKRLGLASSDVSAMIQQDEQNVFRTSLLHNLAEGASRTVFAQPVQVPGTSVFIFLGGLPGCTRDSVVAALDALLLPALSEVEALQKVRAHVLLAGEQQSWQTEGVDNRQNADTAFDAVVQLDFIGIASREIVRDALAGVPAVLYQVLPRIQVYRARGCHVMVQDGRPTELGLRGLDAQRTIAAAGAVNQRSDAVLRCVYGASALGPA